MKLTERDRKVMALVAEHAGNGVTASQIVRASAAWGTELRVWSVQSAAGIARKLADRGYVRAVPHGRMTFWKITGMGRGYLSVDDLPGPSRDRPREGKAAGNG